jgi:hypothetical protein
MAGWQSDELGMTAQQRDGHALGRVHLQAFHLADVAHQGERVERTVGQTPCGPGRQRRGAGRN